MQSRRNEIHYIQRQNGWSSIVWRWLHICSRTERVARKTPLIVVLKKNEKQHRVGLIECNSDDLTHIGKTIYRFCSKLKELPYGYDTIYSGCFSDAGHVHYHLFPLNIDRDKGYKGCALSWLSEKECRSESNSFEKMTPKAKLERLSEIESIVRELIDK